MERLVRKYEQSFRRAKDEMQTWSALQDRLVKQFGNAAAILERLPVLVDSSNYGVLGEDESMTMARDLPGAQKESQELIFRAMAKTIDELKRVSNSLEMIWQNGCQLLRAERQQPTAQQLQQRMGSRPSLQDCTDGLHALYEMHRDELSLKISLLDGLLHAKPEDVVVLQTLLVEQPNIPSNEVQHIFNLISAGDVR